MKIVGIDLSGPRNFADTCLVSFETRGEEIYLTDVREGADDHQILASISSLGQTERIVIGIDAPLSYNPKGGDRASDSDFPLLLTDSLACSRLIDSTLAPNWTATPIPRSFSANMSAKR